MEKTLAPVTPAQDAEAIARIKYASALEVATAPDNLMGQIMRAAESGMPVATLEKLMDLYERVERRTAEKNFFRDLAAFQSESTVIGKNKTAKISTQSGTGYEFDFADYEHIAAAVRPGLIKYGFSYSFDASSSGPMLKCSCILRHHDGHSVTASFDLPTENKSGATPQQKFGGALTYAKRMTLVSVLGLTLGEAEGEASTPAAAPRINDEQAATLQALVDEVKPNVPKLKNHFKVESLSELRVSQYGEAVRILEALRKGAAK